MRNVKSAVVLVEVLLEQKRTEFYESYDRYWPPDEDIKSTTSMDRSGRQGD